MKTKPHLFRALLLASLLLASVKLPAADFDQQHALFGRVLSRHVTNGLVNYSALQADRTDLNTYLDQLAAVTEPDFQAWSRADQLAFLLNLYNAQTLGLILDHYPLKSIREIGVLPRAPWKKKIVRLHGGITTLHALENDVIRRHHPEKPEIHFALVCAALGCPPLRSEPYTGARLDAQLRDQGEKFLGTPDKNRVETGTKTLHLSRIFDWYEGDFKKQAGSVQKFVEPFLAPEAAAALRTGAFKIQHTRYDWSLNEFGKPAPKP